MTENKKTPVEAEVGNEVFSRSPSPEQLARSQRLRIAVDRAGGPAALSRKTGIALTVLYNYMNGQEMKLTRVIKLCVACNVRLEWLVDGVGEMDAGIVTVAMHKQTPEGPKPSGMRVTIAHGVTGTELASAPESLKASPSIWDLVDFELLVVCLELNEDLDKHGGGTLKSARSRLRRALNAYDQKKNDRE
jgi:hypothetical protein